MGVEAKICGLTCAADAALAVRLGARYLGVVLAGGPRLVTRAQVHEVVSAGDGAPVLGVFAGQPTDEILRLRDRTGVRGAQLHEGYDTAAAERLRREEMLVWRVVRLAEAPGADDLLPQADLADVVLVEPRVPGALGGTGVALDLTVAAEARRLLADRRVALAGGLTPETVGRAIALVQPDIVDVSSGVESHPGRKAPERLARFMEAVVGDHPSP